VGRTRTTVLQPYTHQWIGTFSGPGNGEYRAELRQALQAITAYAAAFALPLSHIIVRVDGLYGNKAPLNEILSQQCGVIGRSKEYSWLDLPEVQTRLQSAPDAQLTHPESGSVRDLYDCLAVPLTPAGPVVRLLVATHPTSDHKPAIGVVRKETVYELFYTTLPPHAFTASDVLLLTPMYNCARIKLTAPRAGCKLWSMRVIMHTGGSHDQEQDSEVRRIGVG